MKEDYLWDKSGEPDAEIKQLEEVLSTFKYQPRPLVIPDSVKVGKRGFFIPASIAAGVALLMLGTVLWFAMNRREETPVVKLPEVQSPASNLDTTAPKSSPENNEAVASQTEEPSRGRIESPKPRVVRRPKHIAPVTPELTAAERAEGERAKEQLFIALRLASSKLNQAQKRTQGAPPAHQIRNQHKVG
jgi:hypothetical protein